LPRGRPAAGPRDGPRRGVHGAGAPGDSRLSSQRDRRPPPGHGECSPWRRTPRSTVVFATPGPEIREHPTWGRGHHSIPGTIIRKKGFPMTAPISGFDVEKLKKNALIATIVGFVCGGAIPGVLGLLGYLKA